MGLSWGDVDFVNNTVSVTHSFDRFRNLKEPKTVAGTRVLPMSEFTACALRKRLAAQQGVHPSVLQKLAGHNDLNITLGIYTHVNVDQQCVAMDSMQSVFG